MSQELIVQHHPADWENTAANWMYEAAYALDTAATTVKVLELVEANVDLVVGNLVALPLVYHYQLLEKGAAHPQVRDMLQLPGDQIRTRSRIIS